MAFCTKCGKQLEDGTRFCPGCGAPQNAPAAAPAAPVQTAPVQTAPVQTAPVQTAPVPPVQAAPVYAAPAGQLHCPNCKGTNLTPVVESSVNGALTTSHGNMAATRVSNTHRNYWMCSTCGNKFRNIQNLQEEIVNTEKSVKVAIVMCVISALLFLLLVLKGDAVAKFLFFPFILTVGLFAVVSFCMIFSYKGKAAKMKDELAYLQHHCFH